MVICPHCRKEVTQHQPRIQLLTRTYHAGCMVEHLKAAYQKAGEKDTEEVIDHLFSKTTK